MKRTSKLNKSYNQTRDNIVAKNKKKVSELKKQIAYEEMRKATNTNNTQTLIDLMNKSYTTNDIGQAITGGGAIIGE